MHLPLHRLTLCTLVAGTMLLAAAASPAQEAVTTTAPVSVVPHLIKFSGALPNAPAKAEMVDVKFSLYAAQTGGEALWTETQQVSLDPSGKYSVLLGSVSALPSSAFANGQARWIGVTLSGEQESARTILVATPYSLKASDSETLGGHPASDFTLKNALPASGTDITQINVGSGITGGGTGPTVTLGLSSSYLESLGNNIYPQIAGTNTMTGKNTYTAGKLFIGSSPVLSTANIIAGSEVVLSTSGSNVTVGVNGPGLLKLANGYYPQLGTANSFTGNNTFLGTVLFSNEIGQSLVGPAGDFANEFLNTAANNSGGFLIGSATAGLAASATATTVASGDIQYGLEGATSAPGYNSFGVYGTANAGNLSTGVYGVNTASSAIGASSLSSYGGGGVWGDSNQGTGVAGTAVLATADDQNGIIAINNSPSGYYTLFMANFDDTGNSWPLNIYSDYSQTNCTIDSSSNLTCDGTISGSNVTADQHRIETFAVQSAENWIEDFGTAQLSSGSARVTIDPTFAATVNTGVDYHVFLTPRGDSEGLYIADQSSGSFEVRESRGGKSTLAFDYRIVAKRRGHEAARLTDVTARHANATSPTRMKQMAKPQPRQPLPVASAANHFGLHPVASVVKAGKK